MSEMIPIDEVVYVDVITSHPSTGAATDADSTPTFDVYEESTDTGLLGATNFTKRTSLTGNYRGTFTASAANGFEAGKWYSIVASATVNAIAGKTIVKNFRCCPAEVSAGVPVVDLTYILGTLLTETAGLLAGGFKKFLNVATPTGTLNSLPGAVPGASGGLLVDDVWTDARAAKLDNLDATVSSRLASASYTAPSNATIATINASIGAFTGTGVNTVLGFFKALLKADASLPSDIGGTFDPTTDSMEAGYNAMFVTTVAEPATVAFNATETLAQKIHNMHKIAINRNVADRDTGAWTLYNSDGLTAGQEADLTASGGVAERSAIRIAA